MTNGLVEVGLILASVIMGAFGAGYLSFGVMIALAVFWWAYVHHGRFAGMLKASAFGALGKGLVAMIVLVIGHGLGFLLGRAFRAMLGIA
jgi:hypothetical protein